MLEEITEKLHQHHRLYRYPVKAEYWEDIFDQVINQGRVGWIGGSHASGADVVSVDGIRYQNKSGTINVKRKITDCTINARENTIKWSGHRTTKHKTIDEKVDFISKRHCDKYAMLARNVDEWKRKLMKYYLFIFDSSLIDYKSLEWHETKNKKGVTTGWKGTHKDLEYYAQFTNTSDQLWTTVNLSYLPLPEIITINNDTEFFEYPKQSA